MLADIVLNLVTFFENPHSAPEDAVPNLKIEIRESTVFHDEISQRIVSTEKKSFA